MPHRSHLFKTFLHDREESWYLVGTIFISLCLIIFLFKLKMLIDEKFMKIMGVQSATFFFMPEGMKVLVVKYKSCSFLLNALN